MVNTNTQLSLAVKRDLVDNLAKVMSNDASLTPEAAMLKITMDMLANNPYVPPKGCPVNDLPPELLAYIFQVGTQMEAEGELSEDDDDDDDELVDLADGWSSDGDGMDVDGPSREDKKLDEDELGDAGGEEEFGGESGVEDLVLPFQVLVSHVCRHWREIALESPTLWTTLSFTEGSPFEKSSIWIERSKGLPLDIHIDCTILDDEAIPGEDDAAADSAFPPIRYRIEPNGQVYTGHPECRDPRPPALSLPDLSAILDVLVPHITQWRHFELTCSLYDYMHLLLARLSQCPAAPLLETLQLYHYEDCENYEVFSPRELGTSFLIFNGEAPMLRNVSLWGVHLDWDRSVSLLSGLRDLELAYHAKNVRPSWGTFTKMISSSPDIRTLTLCLSGPAQDEDDNDWGTEPFEIQSLTDLVLCYHEQNYAIGLVRKLSVPNLRSLTLDYDDEDYSEFAQCLTLPMPGRKKSWLAGLENLKIAGLPCNDKTIDTIFEQLVGLKTLNLNCSRDDEEKFFVRLLKSTGVSGGFKLYCPNLHTITTSGITGAHMKAFIFARKAARVPIKRVLMSEEDDVDEQQEQWLRANVEEFEFFEPSDSEEEFIDEDEDEVYSLDGVDAN